jgi:hypothetical protein
MDLIKKQVDILCKDSLNIMFKNFSTDFLFLKKNISWMPKMLTTPNPKSRRTLIHGLII